MSKIIKVRRGEAVDKPVLALAEFGFDTDTENLFIGALSGNKKVSIDEDFVSVGSFGAVGDGVTDDTEALTSAFAYAVSEGKPVFMDSGVYIVNVDKTAIQAGGSTIHYGLELLSDLRIIGNGAEIKIKDNSSSGGTPIRYAILQTNGEVENIQIKGVKFNMNGLNNLIDGNTYVSGAIQISGDGARVDNMKISDCEFLNCNGTNFIVLGQVVASGLQMGKNVVIEDCYFYTNYFNTTDHSSIYGWVEEMVVRNCTFEIASTTDVSGLPPCCIEVHGKDSIVEDCKMVGYKYRKFMFVANNFTSDVENVVVKNNVIRSFEHGIVFFRNTLGHTPVHDVLIEDNFIEINDETSNATLKTAIQMIPPYGCSKVIITGNTFKKIGITKYSAFCDIANGDDDNPIDNIFITGNTVENATRGVNITSVDGKVGLVKISDNIFKNLQTSGANASRGVFATGETPNVVDYLEVANNLFIDTVGAFEYGVFITQYVESLKITGNEFKDILTTDINIQNPAITYYLGEQDRTAYFGTAPTVGTWKVGDRVYNGTPSAGNFIGWVCTVAGTPGTWKTFGAITA